MTDFSQLTDSDLIESVNAWRRTRNITNNGVNDIAHRKYTKLVREGEEEIRNRAALDEDASKVIKKIIPNIKNAVEFHKYNIEIHTKKSTNGSPEYMKAHSAALNAHREAAERYKTAHAQLSHGKPGIKDVARYAIPARKSGEYAVKLSDKADAIKEEVDLNEGTSRLDKDNVVHYNNDTHEFAKHYVSGHKGEYNAGGPTAKHEKDSNTFHSTYSSKNTRNGFAGSGTTIYTHNKTGDKFRVDRDSNGKSFYGTDHLITKIHESVNEAIAGWKHAASDINKARKNISNQNKTVSLVSLKKDGTPSKLNDAVTFHKSEPEAIDYHNRITELNPNRNIKHHLYVNGKLVKTLGEDTNHSKISLAKKYLDRAQAKRNTNSQ